MTDVVAGAAAAAAAGEKTGCKGPCTFLKNLFGFGGDKCCKKVIAGVALAAAAVAIVAVVRSKSQQGAGAGASSPSGVFLNKRRKQAKILEIISLSPDTKLFRLSLGSASARLGLPTGQHISITCPNPKRCQRNNTEKDPVLWNGRTDPEAFDGALTVDRKYTPCTGNETLGHVDLIVKIYLPGQATMPDGTKGPQWADGGKMGAYLNTVKVGDELTVNGPFGKLEYLGRGAFKMLATTHQVTKVGMLAGGTGLTPMLQIMQASLLDPEDTTTFSLLLANKTEDDILAKNLLDECVEKGKGRVSVHYTLDYPPAGWKGEKGFITDAMIKKHLPGPGKDTLVLMCGPPPMVEFACKKNLQKLEYPADSMIAF